MSTQVKTRVFAGAVCDQVIYLMPDAVKQNPPEREPRPRFKNEEERDAHRLHIARRHHALLVNANFGPSSYYSTLTFDRWNEVYDYEDAKKVRDSYWKKLKYRYTDAKMILYMGKGKTTARIHFHLLSDGIPPEVLKELWKYGDIRECRKFRDHNIDRVTGKDHGHDYTNVANYCFDHWEEEQGKGRRYKCTKNLIQPEREKPTVCVRHYDEEHPPIPPKGYLYTGDCYITTYGYMRFRYIVDPHMRE